VRIGVWDWNLFESYFELSFKCRQKIGMPSQYFYPDRYSVSEMGWENFYSDDLSDASHLPSFQPVPECGNPGAGRIGAPFDSINCVG
jgi:hypothetical protein